MRHTNGKRMEVALPLNSPVILVVKTPNQRHEDVQVDCEIGWTVQKLKTHLSNVYPTKPESRHQRIIYSGQLLNDDLKLKDVLREHVEGRPHTVHLVCSSSGVEASLSNQARQASSTINSGSSTEQAASSSSSSQTVTSSTSDGLRYRGQTAPPAPPYYNMYNAQMMNAAAQAQNQGGYYPMMAPPYWMQHMYTQQMMAARGIVPPVFMYPPGNFHLQAAQRNTQPHPPTPPLSPILPPLANEQAQQQAPVEPQQPVAAVAQPAEQDVQMNANGRPLLDEEEDEENANNDWLDKIYTICRLAILFSIVWFYSSTGRFVLMVVSFVVIYMYQSGVLHRILGLNRGVNERIEVQLPAPQQVQEEELEQNGENAADGNEQGNDSTDSNGSSNEESEQPTPPPPPAGPSAIHVAFNFITTFFTSLIPQGPPPPVVN